MRLFFAVELPDEIKHAAFEVCGGLPDVRWIPASRLHLTLHFLGEIAPAFLDEIYAAAEAVISSPFLARLHGTGAFPNARRPSVVWTGVRAEKGLSQLQSRLGEALRESGREPELEPYHPHVTVGRVRRPARVDLTEWLDRHAEFETSPFTVKAFHLFSSELLHSGAEHRLLSSFPLTA